MKLARSLCAAALLASPFAAAKLPPATPEEVAAQQARRAAEEARLAKEKEQLERVQDRVADRYRQDRGRLSGARSNAGDLPHNTKQPEGTAPPEGGNRQSAESHSAPAK